MKFKLLLICFCVLISSCNTQKINIVIGKDTSEISDGVNKPYVIRHGSEITPSVSEVKSEPIKPEPPKVKVDEQKPPVTITVAGCPKYELPKLNPVTPVPTELTDDSEISNSEMIRILTGFARSLRKASIENNDRIQSSYKKYLEKCKK